LIPEDAKETIGHGLAAASALATARAELVNLEKSFTAGRAGEGQRTFRYAPLKTSPAISQCIAPATNELGGRRAFDPTQSRP
jgi:hypothetical protein